MPIAGMPSPPFAFHRREVISLMLFGWGLRVYEPGHSNVSQVVVSLVRVTVHDARDGTRFVPYDRFTRFGTIYFTKT